MLEAKIDALSELIGVTNVLLEKALNAMISGVNKAMGGGATPDPSTGEVVAAQAALPANVAGATVATPAPVAARRGRPPGAKTAAASTTSQVAAAATPAGMPSTSIDDVKLAIVALAKKKGRAKAEAILGGFGVSHADYLKAADFDACIDKLNAETAKA